MIAWVLAFLGFRLHVDTRIAKGFFNPVQRWFDGAAPVENQCAY
jgi:hypothetical protein